MTKTEPKDISAPPETQQSTGYCQDCGGWTVGRFVRAIPGNSGPGVDIVTHDLGTCPGPRRH